MPTRLSAYTGPSFACAGARSHSAAVVVNTKVRPSIDEAHAKPRSLFQLEKVNL